MDPQRRTELIQKLNDKGAKLPCPRCGNEDFAVLDGYSTPNIVAEYSQFQLAGRTLPSVITVCSNCGFVALHALGALEQLQKRTETPQKEPGPQMVKPPGEK